jgi:hypothetical protein
VAKFGGITREVVENIGRLRKQGRVKSLTSRAAEDRMKVEAGEYVPQQAMRRLKFNIEGTPKNNRPKCRARCRGGHSCRATVVDGTLRCRMHGGLSTGPRTPEGRAAIAESNRRRAMLSRAD